MKEPSFHRLGKSIRKESSATHASEKHKHSPEAHKILIDLLDELKNDPALKGWSSLRSMADLHQELGTGLLTDKEIKEASTRLINRLMEQGKYEKVTELEHYFRS